MRFYARFSWRLIWQVVSDLFMVAWAWSWWLAGRFTDQVVGALAEPARRTRDLAGDLQRQSGEAARQAGEVPVVGDELRKPFDQMSTTLGELAASAAEQVAQVEFVASVAGWLVFLIPTLLLLVIWLPRRLAFAARAKEVSGLANTPGGTDLLALRALATQPLAELHTVDDDPVAAWRAGDPEVTDRLAELELIKAGVARRPRGRVRPRSVGGVPRD